MEQMLLSILGPYANGVMGLSLAHWRGRPELFQGLLAGIAAVTVGRSSAIGFWLILKSLGLPQAE